MPYKTPYKLSLSSMVAVHPKKATGTGVARIRPSPRPQNGLDNKALFPYRWIHLRNLLERISRVVGRDRSSPSSHSGSRLRLASGVVNKAQLFHEVAFPSGSDFTISTHGLGFLNQVQRSLWIFMPDMRAPPTPWSRRWASRRINSLARFVGVWIRLYPCGFGAS